MQELCSNEITQYAVAALAIGTVGFIGRMLYVSYTHQDLLNGAKFGNLKAVRAELAKGVKVNTVKDPMTGNSALHWALKNGHIKVASELIAADADLKAVNLKNETPLHVAMGQSRSEGVKLLLPKSDVNAKDVDDATPLMKGAESGLPHNVSALLQFDGVDLDAKNNKGQTALHLAGKHAAVIQILLGKDANPNSKDEREQLPLHVAALNGNVEGLKLLLPKTKDCNTPDKDGATALHVSDVKSAEVLFNSEKVDPNSRNKKGESALHAACYGKNGNFALALLMIRSNKFNLHLPTDNSEGKTAAHIAAEMGAIDVLTALEEKLQAKFKSTLTRDGKSVLQSALDKGKTAVLTKILESVPGEEAKKIEIQGLSLIEWAVVTCDQPLEQILNAKGMYFTFDAINKERVLAKAKELSAKRIATFVQIFPIKIKELREFAEDLQNPAQPQRYRELHELFDQGLLNSLKRRAIVAKHRQNGTHVLLAEVISGDPTTFDQKHLFNSILSTYPEAFRKRIEEIFEKLQKGDPALLNALKAEVPRALKFLLEKEYTMDQLKGYLSISKFLLSLSETRILSQLQQLPI